MYTVHRIARDGLHSALKVGRDYKNVEFIKEKISPLESFDWEAKTSPLSALGGMKGVSKAYDLISDLVGQEKYFGYLSKNH